MAEQDPTFCLVAEIIPEKGSACREQEAELADVSERIWVIESLVIAKVTIDMFLGSGREAN